jgi:Xaa-Pro aminopeptidase
MQTLQPVLLYGRYEWDSRMQPVAEFEARLVEVRQMMRRNAWDGLVVYGDSRENAALCYLTNVVPNQRWSLALIDAERPMQIIASVGARDLPAVTRLTWVEDVRAASEVKARLIEWLLEVCSGGDRAGHMAKVGVVDLDRMRADIGRNVAEVCDGLCEMADATEAIAALRRRKSASELALIRTSYEILQRALAEIERRRQSGATIATALIAGERHARRSGAQDVRSLCSAGGNGFLRPVGDAFDLDSSEPWTVYLAVRLCGYWTEAVTTLASNVPPAVRAVRAAIEKALKLVRPGISGRELLNAMQSELAAYEQHPMLGRRLGRAHGLSLDAEHWTTVDSEDNLIEDGAYVIMAGARDAKRGSVLDSATIIVGREHHEVLRPMAVVLEHQQ